MGEGMGNSRETLPRNMAWTFLVRQMSLYQRFPAHVGGQNLPVFRRCGEILSPININLFAHPKCLAGFCLQYHCYKIQHWKLPMQTENDVPYMLQVVFGFVSRAYTIYRYSLKVPLKDSGLDPNIHFQMRTVFNSRESSKWTIFERWNFECYKLWRTSSMNIPTSVQRSLGFFIPTCAYMNWVGFPEDYRWGIAKTLVDGG